MFLADIEQLPCERDVLRTDTEVLTHPLAHLQLRCRQIGGAGRQAGQLGTHLVTLLAQLGDLPGKASNLIVEFLPLHLQQLPRDSQLIRHHSERIRIGHRLQAGRLHLLVESDASCPALLGLATGIGGDPLQLGHSVTTGLRTGGDQTLPLHNQRRSTLLRLTVLIQQLLAAVRVRLDLGVQQGRSQLGDEQPHGLSLRLQIRPAGQSGVIGVAGNDQRSEHLQLFAGTRDGLVRLHQVLEVLDDPPDLVGGLDAFKHVVAHELVEVAHRLHRHRLPEQFHRLLGADPQQPAHLPGVLREGVEDVGATCAQALAQRDQIRAEVGEVGLDRQFLG